MARPAPGWTPEYAGYLLRRSKVAAANMIGTDPRSAAEKAAGKKWDDRTITVVGPATDGLYQLGKLADMSADYIADKAGYRKTHELNIPIMERQAERVQRNRVRRAETEGIPVDPQNAVELAFDIIPALAGPGGAPRAAQQAGRSFIRKAATQTAKTAVEATLPLAQGGLKTRAAALGIGVGAGEAIDHVVDANIPEAKDDYHHIGEDVSAYHEMNNPTAEFIDPYSQPKEEFIDPYTEIAQEFVDPYNERDQFSAVPEEDRSMTIGEKAMIAAGGAILAGLGLRARASWKGALEAKRAAAQTGQLVGSPADEQKTSLATNLSSNFINEREAVKAAVRKDAPAVAPRIDNEQNLIAPAVINTKFQHAFETGELPESAVNLGSIGPELNTIVKTLTPGERMVLSRGLAAKTALDQIATATAAKRGVYTQTMFNGYTNAELEAFARTVDLDPKLSAAAATIRNAFRKIPDYLEEQGRITPQQKAAWLTANPNYVHLSKGNIDTNDTSFFGIQVGRKGSLHEADSLQHRTLDTAEGVQSVADPLVDFPRYLRAVITDVEHNKARRSALEALDGGATFGVRRVAKPADDTITVQIQGQDVHYRVPDKALHAGLLYNPTLSTNWFTQAGNAVNKVFIPTVVGKKLNPLFPLTSAIYDNQTQRLTRLPGTHLGVLNEILNKAGLQPGRIVGNTLSTLDPSQLAVIQIPVGSMRYLIDSGAQAFSRRLVDSIARSDGFLDSVLDPQTKQNLADWLTNFYLNSNKAEGMRLGVFGRHVYDHEDLQRPLSGIEDVAPDLSVYGAESALALSPTKLHSAWAASNLMNVRANAEPMSRLLFTIQNAVKEAPTYQAIAANRRAFTDKTEFAAKMRRLGGDMGQRGMGEGGQTANALIPFFNQAGQPVAEFVDIIRKNPAQAMLNITSVIAPSLVLQYLAAASDPEVAEKLRNDSPGQAANRMYLPGGVQLPTEQLTRPIWGMSVQLLNELSGLNDGEFDPNFVKALQRLADVGIDEETWEGMMASFKAGEQAANPIHVSNIPLANVAGSLAGIDMGLSRVAGEVVPIDNKENVEGNFISKQHEKAITSVFAGTVAAYIEAMLDFAYTAKGSDGDVGQAMRVGMSRITDKVANTNGPIEGMLYKDYEKVISANDPAQQLMHKKLDRIRDITTVYNEDVRAPGMTGVDFRTNMELPSNRPELVKEQYRQTALRPIGEETARLMRDIRDAQSELNKLVERDRTIRDKNEIFLPTIEQRNAMRNQTLARRQELVDLILFDTKQAEERIRVRIGDPTFSYQNFDLQKYARQPYVPPPPDFVPPTQ